MQVDPIKPTLKAPGTKPLTLKCDKLISNSAFNFNLLRYTVGNAAVRRLVEERGWSAAGPPNMPISAYRLGELPIQSCGQSVSAPRGKAGARLNAHTYLRVKRQRSAREAIYRNRHIVPFQLNLYNFEG